MGADLCKSRNVRKPKPEPKHEPEPNTKEQIEEEKVVVSPKQQKPNLTQIQIIHEKYGSQAIKNLLARYDSPYQSLPYVRINDKCDQLITEIENKGHSTIDSYKQKSQSDFEEVLKQIEQQQYGIVKKTEAKTRKPIRELLGYEEQIAKYEDTRTMMKEKFTNERFQLKKVIKQFTRERQSININEEYPEFEQKQDEQKLKMIDEAEDKYGKKWLEKQQSERKDYTEGKAQNSPQVIQFNFTHDHKPRFQSLIPTEECEQKRTQIKEYFQYSAKDALGTETICC